LGGEGRPRFSGTKTLETSRQTMERGILFAGRYEIIEALGVGGMGEVYRVEDKKVGQEIALKLIKPEIAADLKNIERFRHEMKFARMISHRNVCRMFDLGEDKGTYFITMEYVAGEDLKSFIRRAAPLSPARALAIIRQTAEGLAEAHRLGVIHRDLKPANVMIDREGNVRIMDFGIARSLTARGITGVGTIIGTPEYMSPEQVEGKDADHRSDLYSLGIIMFEMLTGQVPFGGDTPLSIAVKQKSEPAPSAKKLNPQISENLNTVILDCLEKDRDKRPQNAEDLLFRLRKIEADFAPPERAKSESGRGEKTDSGTWKSSIAVMPFVDLSPQKDQEYFCDGIAEEIINYLSKIKNLRVVARTSAFSFKGQSLNIRDIGRKLSVDKVLEGSVRKAGNRLRITAQLINVEDDTPLWSEQYNRELNDVFAIQDEITREMIGNLKIKLLGNEQGDLVKRHTEDPAAHNLYLKGRFFWNKRTESGLKKAIEHFEKAIEIDPNYAMAYAGISDCNNLLPWYGTVPPKDSHPRAKAAALKALDIDDGLAEAHTSLAFAIMQYDWDWEAAEREFKRAIELNRGYAAAHHWYFEYLSAMGRRDEAMLEVQQAHQLDPLSLIINGALGWAYYFSGQYDLTVEQSRKTLEMDPDFLWSRYILGMAYLQISRPDKAVEVLQESTEHAEFRPLIVAVRGAAYGRNGQRDKALGMLELLGKHAGENYLLPSYAAMIFLGLGEYERVFENLEWAFERRNFWLMFLKADPFYDVIRGYPEYRTLLKKLKLE